MTLTQVWGTLLICILCPLLGGLPLIDWITFALTRQRLSQIGTRNISVSAAFYHGGTIVGILAVMSEAFKGIAAVLLARYFFPTDAAWEVIALIALVFGRYWIGKGAGTTNVVWGFIIHDWITSALVFLVGGISFTILRERRSGKLGVLLLLALMTVLRHPAEGGLVGATVVLCILIAWIYQKIPDDLDLPEGNVQHSSRKTFRFFQGDRAIPNLDQSLHANRVGQKAANLAQLRRWGYPVPMGWVLPPGDDAAPLLSMLQPSPDAPVAVRSSAIGEDSDIASAAGQYESILDITSSAALEHALLQCQASYNLPAATRYRQDRGVAETGMAVLVQLQVQGVFSGVAFSRDPITCQGDAVVIEALPGMASRVVSGQFTPKQYRVWIRSNAAQQTDRIEQKTGKNKTKTNWTVPEGVSFQIEGEGAIPTQLIEQVAYLARQLELRYHGIPQDIEWTYDGKQIWLLQARPITTLLPIWTRKIAAEVIPGFIHPLTWSINRPLTCGVWGEIFTIVLGDRANGLDFDQTATLHNSAAYFNASLLGQIFLRMGLPPESLEFLTRGAKFSKPPLLSTLRNLPGLIRLARCEMQLIKNFEQAYHHGFAPSLAELDNQPIAQLTAVDLLKRIYRILRLLKQATYYSIFAPLSAALRQALFKVQQSEVDNSQTPEVASIRSLQFLANKARPILAKLDPQAADREAIFAALAQHPEGQTILHQFDQFLAHYGYLSEVATDIAVPTWKEDPQPVKDLLTQFLLNPVPEVFHATTLKSNWQLRQVQQRIDLKGRVTAIYSRLLAELRWSFISLEAHWRSTGLLTQPGDIFFLKFDEIERLATDADPQLAAQVLQLVEQRRKQLDHDRQLTPPMLVYGNAAPMPLEPPSILRSGTVSQLQGIGASPGQITGQVKVLRRFQDNVTIDRHTILVVPYTDSGWAPLLAQAGGLIAEVGGQLSHGAIVAREYRIPAVMDIHQATQLLQDGQQVRIDGQRGIVEVLNDLVE